MDIPIKNMLKKRSQQELAVLQDEVVDLLYFVDSKAVFHGGTCIWRCFGGKRFSEDLDFYLAPTGNFEEKLVLEAKRRGLKTTKYRKTENSIYAKISNERTECSLELALRKKEGTLSQYEKADGGKMNVLALTKEELVIEKANAFVSRKLIRDIYDVCFLLDKSDLKKVKSKLAPLAEAFKAPLDEKNLKVLVYSGNVPTFNQMLAKIKAMLK